MLIMFKVKGDDILVEVKNSLNSKKILIYVEEVEGGYIESCKCFATHYIEQTLDNDNNVIEENIKRNPHYVDWKYPKKYMRLRV